MVLEEVVRELSSVGGVGVVLGGVRSWSLYLAVFHARGALPPLGDGRVFLAF